MTDEEILAWLERIGSDLEGRIRVLKDLISHMEEDQMSPSDRDICLGVLEVLQEIEGGVEGTDEPFAHQGRWEE